MFATTPSARPMQSLRLEASTMTCHESAAKSCIGSPGNSSPTSSSSLSDEATQSRMPPEWTCRTSNGSTRAGSPSGSCSSSSDESRETNAKLVHKDMGGLATRRGVTPFNELVLDFETEGIENSHANLSSVQRPHCTPYTPLMTSFSPPKSSVASDTSQISPGTSPSAYHTYPSLLRTSPLSKSGDASQRTVVCRNRLGGYAAGGDASQRSPLGRVSLGVAVIGGDASQRTPPGRTSQAQYGSLLPRQQRGSTSCITGCLAVPSPKSSHAPTMQDASARRPDMNQCKKSAVPNPDSLKSWLSGANCERSSLLCDQDIAEKLRAAVPDVYED